MPIIHSNLKEVMEKHDPKLSIRKLAKDVNYHFDSIRRMYKDEMVQYPRDLLLKLCVYFNVQPGELIRMQEQDKEWTMNQSADDREAMNDRGTAHNTEAVHNRETGSQDEGTANTADL